MTSEKSGRKVLRLPPCPSYDVEGMESWLCVLAKKGLFLAQDGFFAGVASFERGQPREVKYRLEAAQKSTSILAPDGGEPDPEQVELGEKYSWSYVARRGDFYIYRSDTPGARELNTDPEVQRMALGSVKKRAIDSLIAPVLLLALAVYLMVRGGALLAIVNMRSWFFLLMGAYIVWMIADALHAVATVGRFQKKLRDWDGDGGGGAPEVRRRSGAGYHARRSVKFALFMVIVVVLLRGWSADATGGNRVQLDRYDGEIPFVTMRDLAGDGASGYRMTMTGLSLGFNSIERWSDWLAPVCIKYAEHAAMTRADGSAFVGGLYVDYFETAAPWIARGIAEEYLRTARWGKYYSPLEMAELGVSFAAAYSDELHFPTVVMQEGSTVMRVTFYQTSEDYTMQLDEWAQAFAAKIKQ